MSQLDLAVTRAVESYRKVFAFLAVIGIGSSFVYGDLSWAVLVACSLAVLYYVGLIALGYGMSFVLPKSVLQQELRTKRINEINRRLDEGSLEAGSEELEEMMKNAGLEPLHVITGYGQIFGKQFDANLYEWVEAKKGRLGDIVRHDFVGPASFDADGCIETPNDEGVFLVLDGFLYEHTPEPKNDDVQQSRAEIQ